MLVMLIEELTSKGVELVPFHNKVDNSESDGLSLVT